MGAVGFVAAGLLGGAGRTAALGLAVLVLGEAWLFAAHYQPMNLASQVPPKTVVTSWLQSHAGQSPIAATDVVLVPDSATLYGLSDVQTYNALRSARSRAYWSAADPGYHDELLYTLLQRPSVEWLARAGVRYFITRQGSELAGTTLVFRADGVTVAEVPGYRPFLSASSAWSSASNADQARAALIADSSGPPVLEGASPQRGSGGDTASISLISREPGYVHFRVSTRSRQAIVVLQSYDAGWAAFVDGRGVQVHPADLDFQAVLVPAGEHDVVLSYRPAVVPVGLAVSGVAAAVILAMVVLGWRRRKRLGG